MVSAVFHSPLDKAPAAVLLTAREVQPSVNTVAADTAVTSVQATASPAPFKPPFDWRGLWLKVLPPIFGMGLLVGVWALIAIKSTSGFPTPLETFRQAVDVFSDPFYSKGPNDQGIGWNVLSSLKRVPWASASRPSSESRPAS